MTCRCSWVIIKRITVLFGKGGAIGYFEHTIPDAALHARALLLSLLRERHPSDDGLGELAQAVDSCLRLNPDDAEMKEAWEKYMGRAHTADGCRHNGFLLLEPVQTGSCAARCVLCGTLAPVRVTPEAARKALLVLGVQHTG
jgi:hypothetical protein